METTALWNYYTVATVIQVINQDLQYTFLCVKEQLASYSSALPIILIVYSYITSKASLKFISYLLVVIQGSYSKMSSYS